VSILVTDQLPRKFEIASNPSAIVGATVLGQLQNLAAIARPRVPLTELQVTPAILQVAGYKFQALHTNLPAQVSAVEVWRRYNGRADIENRIKEPSERSADGDDGGAQWR
jgi:hypothetical protein